MTDLAARREARMRKILENSENRLSRITGVENKSVSSQEKLPVSPRNSNQADCVNPESSCDLPRRPQQLDVPQDGFVQDDNAAITNLLAQLNPALLESPVNSSPVVDQQILNDTRSESSRLVAICLIAVAYSVIVTILNKTVSEDLTNSPVNTIFAPLFAYEIYELIFTQRKPQMSTVMTYVLLFIQSRSGRKYASVVNVLMKLGDILHDVLVYFFIYVVSNLFTSLIV